MKSTGVWVPAPTEQANVAQTPITLVSRDLTLSSSHNMHVNMYTLNNLEGKEGGGGREERRKREKEEGKGRGRRGEKEEDRSGKRRRGGGAPSQGHGVENQKAVCSSMGVGLAGRHGGNFLE